MNTEIDNDDSGEKKGAPAGESRSPSIVKAHPDNHAKATRRHAKNADPNHRKSLRRSWRSASPLTQLQIILTTVIAAATVIYAIFPAWQWHDICAGGEVTHTPAEAAPTQIKTFGKQTKSIRAD